MEIKKKFNSFYLNLYFKKNEDSESTPIRD